MEDGAAHWKEVQAVAERVRLLALKVKYLAAAMSKNALRIDVADDPQAIARDLPQPSQLARYACAMERRGKKTPGLSGGGRC